MAEPAPLRPLIIGIAGGSGSGKTTVARAITDPLDLDAVLIDADAYYCDLAHLSLEERKQGNFDHPDALDIALLADHLTKLAKGQSIENRRTISLPTPGLPAPSSWSLGMWCWSTAF